MRIYREGMNARNSSTENVNNENRAYNQRYSCKEINTK